jgi:hypothetical protein
MMASTGALFDMTVLAEAAYANFFNDGESFAQALQTAGLSATQT